MKPLLSIIIPVYNTSLFLTENIMSFMLQSANSEDYEIIYIDDGSTDNCLEILTSFCKDKQNFCVFTQSNAGVSNARNTGLLKSKGSYVWFVDGDDCIQSHCLAGIIGFLKENDADILRMGHISFNGRIESDSRPFLFEKCNAKENAIKFFEDVDGGIWSAIYKKELLIKNRLFFNEELTYFEDCLFDISAVKYAEKLYKTNKVCYCYRTNLNSVSHKKNYEKLINSAYTCAVELNKIYLCETNPSFKEREYRFIRNCRQSLLTELIALGDTAVAKRYISMLKSVKLYPFKIYKKKLIKYKGIKKKYSILKNEMLSREWFFNMMLKKSAKNKIQE